jgi:flagellar export protein FliJ
MANLKSLIRVRRHTVEQKQKALSDLYRKAEQLAQEKTALLDRLEEERASLQSMDVQMLSYFGPYSEAVKLRVLEIDKAAATLEARIEIARDDIRRAFSELKKVEITQERREDKQEAALNKKESQELDEIAIEGFRRKQEE